MSAAKGRLTPAQKELLGSVQRRLGGSFFCCASGRKIGKGSHVRTVHVEGLTAKEVAALKHRTLPVGSAATLARLADKGHLVPVATWVGRHGAEIVTYRLPAQGLTPEEEARMVANRERFDTIVKACTCFRRTFGGGAGIYDHSHDCAAHAAVALLSQDDPQPT